MASNKNLTEISAFVNDYFEGNCFLDLFLSYDEIMHFPENFDVFILEKSVLADDEFRELISRFSDSCKIICFANKNEKLDENVDFVDLPVSTTKLKEILNGYSDLKSSADRVFHFSVGREKRLVALHKIMYVENKNRISKIFLTNGKVYRVRENIKNIFNRIKNSDFIMTHNDFILNLAYVKKAEGDCFVLESGDTIPIRTYGRANIVSLFYEYRYEKFKKPPF